MSVHVLFCNCGGTLAERLDIEALKGFAEGVEGVAGVGEVACACVPTISAELKDQVGDAEKVVAVACSRVVCQAPLEAAMKAAGLSPDELVILNAKEQVAWVHEDQGEATGKARMMLSAAVRQAGLRSTPERVTFERFGDALVIGGGISGLTAGSELADKGRRVHLVERKPTIGGAMVLLAKTFPEEDCTVCLRGPHLITLMSKPNLEISTNSEVTEVVKVDRGFKARVTKRPRYVNPDACDGCGKCADVCPISVPDEYSYGLTERRAVYLPTPLAVPNKYLIDPESCLYLKDGSCRECQKACPSGAIDFEQQPVEEELEVGSVIVATGFEDFDPTDVGKYGFRDGDVVTQFQLARMLDPLGPTGGIMTRPSDGKVPQRIVMIQCAGSRDPEVNPWCSKHCCMSAIKNATIIKKFKRPDAEVTVLFKDIRASGYGFEKLYNEAKDRLGVKFVHGDIVGVYRQNPSTLAVEYTDARGDVKTLTADMVSLSVGMTPPEGSEELAKMLGVELTDFGFMAEVDEKVANTVTRVPGVYVCGACSSPKNIPESISQAGAAAYNADMHMGHYVEKRVEKPEVNQDTCGKCGICRSVCPYEAITIPEDDYPVIDSELCQSCGLCVSSCPTHSLEHPNFGFDLIDEQVEAVVAQRREEEPLIIGLCCDDCGYNLLDTAGFEGLDYPASFVPVYVNCMSSVSLRHVLHALEAGADGVMMVGCVEDRCHFLKGTERSADQVKLIEAFFSNQGLESRVKGLRSCGTMVAQFTEAVREMTERIREG